MAKSQETFNKKEKEKKKQKKKQDKLQKKADRKAANAEKGKSLDDMIAYMDEDGNISSTPPDPSKKRSTIKAEDIPVSTPKKSSAPVDAVRKGAITYFDDSKGYGFIRDNETQESVFVHVNGLIDEVREGDKVSFETVKGQKGPNAVNVKRL